MKRRAALAAAVALWANGALGQDEAPVRVSARAPCSDDAAFLHQLLARTPRARAAREAESATRFVVTIDAKGEKYHGELIVESPEGGRATRGVDATSCQDVVSALALVAALTIDPDAISRLSEPPPKRPAPAPPPTAETPPPPEPKPAPAPRPEVTPPTDHWEFFVGFGAEASGGAVPALGVAARAIVGAGRRGELSPSAFLSLSRASGHTDVDDLGRADFTLLAARLEGCPLRLELGALAALPCAGAELGRLGAEGSGIRQTDSASRWWAAGTLRGTLELRPVSVLALGLSAGALLPFTRDRFVFVDGAAEHLAHRAPALAGFAGLSMTAIVAP